MLPEDRRSRWMKLSHSVQIGHRVPGPRSPPTKEALQSLFLKISPDPTPRNLAFEEPLIQNWLGMEGRDPRLRSFDESVPSPKDTIVTFDFVVADFTELAALKSKDVGCV